MRRQVKVYTPLMKYERHLYTIQDVQLWRPVTYQQLGFFGSGLGGMLVLSFLPGLSFIANNWILSFIIIPVAFSLFMTKFKLDGKMPHTYLWDFILFRLNAGVFNRYQPIEKPNKYKYATVITYRRGDDRQ